MDTGVLYDDVVWTLRNASRTSGIRQGAVGGALRLFAPDHVYRETYERLDGFDRRGVSREAFLGCFEQHYLPLISFVQVDPAPADSTVARVADPDDRPTAALAVLLAPATTLSVDPHLVDVGFGPGRGWLEHAWAALERGQLDVGLWLAAQAAKAGARHVRSATRWLSDDLRPSQVAIGLALAVAVSGVLPTRGARAIEAAVGSVAVAARDIGAITAQVGLAGLHERGLRETRLRQSALAPSASPSIPQRAARLLAVGDTVQRLEPLAAQIGLEPERLGPLLKRNPAFVETEVGWRIGRHLPVPVDRPDPSAACG